jgi:hypothetical protein
VNNAIYFRLKRLLRPRGDLSQKILEGAKGLIHLTIAFTEFASVIVETPESIGNVRNENLREVLLQIHLDKLGTGHLLEGT